MPKPELLLEMYRIRRIEETIAEKYKEQKMRCPVHLSIGQEATAVGVAKALPRSAKMFSTHRGHAHYLAKGGSLKGLIGELYGKASGCSRGNGGSMHLTDPSVGFVASTSIVGGTIPVGVGYAFANKLKGSDEITIICFGDGAMEEGVFHEAMNFCCLHKLNVFFVCEDNQFSCFTHKTERHGFNIKRLVTGYDIAFRATSSEVDDIHKATSLLYMNPVLSTRFLYIPTWRYVEHCGPSNDDHLGYRDPVTNAHYESKDELRNFYIPRDQLEKIEREIQEAFQDAEAAPFPHGEEGKYVFKNNHV